MRSFFVGIIKKVLLVFVAAFEAFFTLFFMASMFVSSAFYYVIRVVTWPIRFVMNVYEKFFGKPKKPMYEVGSEKRKSKKRK
ncbi:MULTISPECIES: hypothetical protein [Flammeovirga]|uniref:Uncharacterized protein n=1 Tax=Flammeovirga agarivorans TaxID=2726742 RepID=A0A7X8XXW3_9BACT|nr:MULTISPECIES: hypothetical protein [Flammeovirga]NLR93649.1 hypothetical protein [Flammeovirga agarivorans]